MSAQPSPAYSALLSPEQTEALLKEELAGGGFEPTAGLTAIFRAVGVMAVELAPYRRLVSTRMVLFGLERLSQAPPDGQEVGASEWRVIEAAGALFRRDPDRLNSLRESYFDSEGSDGPSPKPAALSSNVRSVLKGLMDRQKDSPGEKVITVADFLLEFPPPESRAHDTLRELSVNRSELHEAVAKASKEAENDRVATHRDEPAEKDELGRLAFAGVLADRIRDAYDRKKKSAFIVHIHGPWGSGKSSVLNFLEKDLKADKWVVVKFNAWRDQRIQPPWWSLIEAIFTGARSGLRESGDEFQAARLGFQWAFWRLRADFLPIAAAMACVALTVALIALGVTATTNAAVTVIGGTITLAGAVYVGSRSLALGSQRAAQAYADLKSDPYEPITKLFSRVIDAIDPPVAVFIDDLDRCDGKYVVDLLEGIQTLMRGSSVTYVIAADRKWICSSFEQRYAGFTPPIGEPGRPLGYLFLDKIFQISAAIPQLPDDRQSSYWDALLKTETAGGSAPAGSTPSDAARKAEADVESLTTHEELENYLRAEEKSGDETRIQAARAAAARRITSSAAALETTHRLSRFATLLEPNPRAMKRLVNAYGMHQATLFLSGRKAGAVELARWTIIELRWPLLADFLAMRPSCLDSIRNRLTEGAMPEVPKALRDLFGDDFVTRVVGEPDDDGLTPMGISSILGIHHGER